MKRINAYHLGNNRFVRNVVLMVLLIVLWSRQPVLADLSGPQTLSLTMTMVTGTRISLGEPIVFHYMIRNTASTGQATFHAGEKNNEWYKFSLTDARGHTITAAPAPTVSETQGLHHSPETSIPHGDRMEGDLVATRYLAVPGPGVYTLTVHALASYYIEPDRAGWYPQGRPPSLKLVDLTPNFRFPITVTPPNPAVIRTTAEDLSRKLSDVAYAGQWESFTEQLFSLPEAQALPTWESLLTNPRTDASVLRNAADQLASQPSAAHADLLAEALWDGAQPMDTFAHPWVSRTLFKMYETATGPLKRHIRSLYTAHGNNDIEFSEAMKTRH